MSYRIEYASSSRSKCKGRKPCNGTFIAKGDMRLGTVVTIKDHSTFAWRHWGCVTGQVAKNLIESVDQPQNLDGFEDLRPEDQAKVIRLYQTGGEEPQPAPETAKKAKGSGAKRKAEDATDSSGGEGPVKRGRGRPRKSETVAAPKTAPHAAQGDQPKRGRGRPRKSEANGAAAVRSSSGSGAGEAPKRGRGRPKKVEDDGSDVLASSLAVPGYSTEEEAPKPKRGRGRPKKTEA